MKFGLRGIKIDRYQVPAKMRRIGPRCYLSGMPGLRRGQQYLSLPGQGPQEKNRAEHIVRAAELEKAFRRYISIGKAIIYLCENGRQVAVAYLEPAVGNVIATGPFLVAGFGDQRAEHYANTAIPSGEKI